MSALAAALGRRGNLLAGALILWFAVLAVLPDVRPLKTTRFYYNCFNRRSIDMLAMRFRLDPAQRYSPGFGWDSFNSLPYLAAAGLVHRVLPWRLASLRMVSVLSSSLGLWCVYLLLRRLYSAPLGILALALLATSPVYLEGMRAYGYIPFTNAVIAVMVWLLVSSLGARGGYGAAAAMGVLGVALLSLYRVGGLVLFLPLVVYGLRLREGWKKLLVYGGTLMLTVLALDLCLGDTHFRPGEFLFGGIEWLEDNPQGPPEPFLQRMGVRLRQNSAIALRYLFSIARQPYGFQAGEVCQHRLFNPVYTPFFWLGAAACIWKRGRLEGLLLIWWLMFFLVPFLSTGIHDIRIAFSLVPMYALIALGLDTAASWLARFPRAGRWAAPGCLLLLAPVFSYDVHEYLFRASAMVGGHSREQLRGMALALGAAAREAEVVRYNDSAGVRIWGNPYVDSRYIDMDFAFRMRKYPMRGDPAGLEGQVAAAVGEGRSQLFVVGLGRFPYDEDGGESDSRSAREFIGRAKQLYGDRLLISVAPGLDEVYFLAVPRRN